MKRNSIWISLLVAMSVMVGACTTPTATEAVPAATAPAVSAASTQYAPPTQAPAPAPAATVATGPIEIKAMVCEGFHGEEEGGWFYGMEFREFQKSSNITVNWMDLPCTGYYDVMKTSMISGDLPDMFAINIGESSSVIAADMGYYHDLSNVESFKNFSASIQKATSLDGKPVIASSGVGVLGVMYNVDLFKEIGYAEFPKSWTELMDAGKKLNAKGIALYAGNSGQTTQALIWHWAFGSAALQSDSFREVYLANKVDWSKPENRAILVEGFNRFKEMHTYVLPGTYTGDDNFMISAVVNKSAAMAQGGTWVASSWVALKPSFEFKLANLPYADDEGKNPYIFVPEDGFAINAKSSPGKIAAAEKFFNWLYSKEKYAKFSKNRGSFSAQTGPADMHPAMNDVPAWLDTDRVISFTNTGPMPGNTFIALGTASQGYALGKDLDAQIDEFIAAYNSTMAE